MTKIRLTTVVGILATELTRAEEGVCLQNHVVGLQGHKGWDVNGGVLFVVDSAFPFLPAMQLLPEGATGGGIDGRLVKRVCA